MDKEEIINYVLHSPENTNANILREMLDQLGGGGSVLVVGLTQDEQTGDFSLDKTWQEIHDAAPFVWAKVEESYMPFAAVDVDGTPQEYGVGFWGSDGKVQWFITDSTDGYPIEESGLPSQDLPHA